MEYLKDIFGRKVKAMKIYPYNLSPPFYYLMFDTFFRGEKDLKEVKC
jgi:hypothetical protein